MENIRMKVNITQELQLADSWNFCDLLSRLLTATHTNLEHLCEGLCSVSMMSRILSGERQPDKWMRDRLLERLGSTVDGYESFLYAEDYEQWKIRQDILRQVDAPNTLRADELLEDYHRKISDEDVLQKQFYLVMKAQLMLYRKLPDEKIAPVFEEAAMLTIPHLDERNVNDLLLSVQELDLVLKYEKYRHPHRLPSRCIEILTYIEHSNMDDYCKAKIYPKAVYYLCCSMEQDTGKTNSLLSLCNKAIENLRNTSRMYYLWELLTIREHLLEALLNSAPVSVKNREPLLKMMQESADWRITLEDIYRENHLPVQMTNCCYLYQQQETYCINDVIRIRREMFHLTKNSSVRESVQKKPLVAWRQNVPGLRLQLSASSSNGLVCLGNINVQKSSQTIRKLWSYWIVLLNIWIIANLKRHFPYWSSLKIRFHLNIH